MGAKGAWLELAAAVLAEDDAQQAQRLIGEGLTTHTRARTAARVTLGPDPDCITISVVGELQPPESVPLPSARLVRRHPLHAYHADTGDCGPAYLPDVMRAGWLLDPAGRETMAALGLPETQVSVVVSTAAATWDGWVLLADGSFRQRDLDQLRAVRPLLVGMTRHCALLPIATDSSADGEVRLTPRERMVLSLMAQGRTAEGIATRMTISPRTVHKHQEHLYRKLGAADRLSAVLAAQRLGLVTR